MFDAGLVTTMVAETWVLSAVILLVGNQSGESKLIDASVLRIIRPLRLTRMARVVRLFRSVPELLILIKGIAAAARSVFFTLILLLLLLYAFGISMKQMTEGTSIGS